MDKIITDFSDIIAGWMNMNIYDYRTEEVRKTRVSYIQDFFDDLLMMCKFLLSPITGIYEVNIDQEGYDSSIKCLRYQLGKDSEMTVELRIARFEDEPYSIEEELVDNVLTYFNVNVGDFVKNTINLIERYKKEYNEGFVLSPSNELDEKLLKDVKKKYEFLKGSEKI